MVCEISDNVIVCGPPRGVYRRLDEHACPSCNESHGFVVHWDGAWYGVTLYGSCGDRWQDGWRATRPFSRYWRRDAQAAFQRMWEHSIPADLYEAYTQADVEMACADDATVDEAIKKREAAHAAISAYHSTEKSR